MIIGADADALFPSMLAMLTGRLVRMAARKTKLKVEGMNYKEVARYVVFGGDEFVIRSLNLEKALPWRRYNRGTTPGITGKEPLGKHSNDEIRWVFPERDLTEKEKKDLLAVALEIGVRTSFENHLYQFGGTVYHQTSGGPIGLRVTMAAARIVMGEWGEIYTNIMLQAELKIWLRGFYVDDVRTVTSVLEKGKRWDIKEKKFSFKEEWRIEDEEMGESNTRRMARQMNKAMNSILENINFTMEIPEDFEGEKLPTLDFKMWVEDKKEIRYSFYEKEVNTPYCIMEKSAMAERSKISSLSQDVIRRLQNNCKDTCQAEKNAIIETYIRKLKISGYSKSQIKEIISSGLKGYVTKVERAEEEGRSFHRGATQTLAGRQKKKLTQKTNWYKKKKGKQDTDGGGKRGNRRPKIQEGKDQEIKSILFVPRTKGGELAARLRKEEETLGKMTGYRVKVVERSGKMVKRMLHKSNSWAGEDCGREDCLVCAHQGGEEGGAGDCKRRNIVYATTCLECKKEGKEVNYFGESARTSFERGKEHQSDYESLASDSHMLKHHILEHSGREENLPFSMKILRSHMTAFSRQIHEAVVIQRNERKTIMNSKGEYSRCRLPRLSVMMGKKEMEEKDKSTVEMTEMEIEAEIRKLRCKKRNRVIQEKEIEYQGIQEPQRKRRRRWKVETARKRKETYTGTTEKIAKKMKKEDTTEIQHQQPPENSDVAEKYEKIKKNHQFFSNFENLSRKSPGNDQNAQTEIKKKMLFPIFNISSQNQTSRGSKLKPEYKAKPTASPTNYQATRGVQNNKKKSSSSTPAAKVRPIYMYFKTTLEETISPPPPLPPPQLIPNKASLEKDSESEIQLPTNLKITHSRMS